MPTHQHRQSYYTPSQAIEDTDSFDYESEVNIAVTIPASTTNQEILIAIDVSELKSLCLSSDYSLTIKTNSSGSPTDTIALVGGKPYIWTVNSYDTCKLTADVTKIYVTNGSGTNAAALKVSALVNI